MTDALRVKPRPRPGRSGAVARRVLAYLPVQAPLDLVPGPRVHEGVPKGPAPHIRGPFDFLVVAADVSEPLEALLQDGRLSETAAVVVEGIRKDDRSLGAWRRWAEDSRFDLVLDLYGCGLLFRRPGQAREFRCLRI